jgi:predicted nucleic acid-binding Zn ribbon protein
MSHGGPRRSDGGVQHCGECGEQLEGNANFCPECGAAVGETLAEYCRSCGGQFDPDDRFCSDCDAVRNPDATDAKPDEEDEYTEEEMWKFRTRVQAHLTEDWELEEDYGDKVVLVNPSTGHPLAHLALFLFTAGIGNFFYAWYSYKYNTERIVLSAEEGSAEETPVGEAPVEPVSIDSVAEEDTGIERMVGGVFLVLLGVLMIASSPLTARSWLFGLVALAAGLYVFPPARRRLARRYPVTKNGKVRTTDETIVSAPETPCVVCGRPVEDGIKRTFREELAVAGVPIATTRGGENHYCDACAMVDPELDTSGLSVGQTETPSIESTLETETETS